MGHNESHTYRLIYGQKFDLQSRQIKQCQERGKDLSLFLTTMYISFLAIFLGHSTCRACQQPQKHLNWRLVKNKESKSQSRFPEFPLTCKGPFLLLSFEDIWHHYATRDKKDLLQLLAFFLPSKIFYLKVSISQITKITKLHHNAIGTVLLSLSHTCQREVSLLKCWQW